MSRGKIRIFISACEPSGDQLGAELMAALDSGPATEIDFHGIGGTAMAARGLRSLFPTGDLAVMGLGDVLPRARRNLSLARRVAAAVVSAQPDIVLTIDSMGFHKPMVSEVKRRRPSQKVLHYAAPKYWAWWPGRARRIAGLFDEILCLFPFEPSFFSSFGLNCRYVGHPVVDRMDCDPEEVMRLQRRLNIPDELPVALVLPGSRPAEVKRLLPVFAGAIQRLRRSLPGLATITPASPLVAERLKQAIAEWGPHSHVIEGEADRRAAFHLGHAALAASGTVALELAACNIPHVTAYKVGPVSALIARRLIRIDHVNLVNILAGKPVVPEFLQAACRPGNLAFSLRELLSGPDQQTPQQAAFKQVMSDLGWGGDVAPAAQAAAAVRQHFP